MEYSKFKITDSNVWHDKSAKKIKKEFKDDYCTKYLIQLIKTYLRWNNSANYTGVYYIALHTISSDLGAPEEDVLVAVNWLIKDGFCDYDFDLDYVWVKNMLLDQTSVSMKLNDNQIVGINKKVKDFPKELCFLGDFLDMYETSHHIRYEPEEIY
jgi:hypothetical protein